MKKPSELLKVYFPHTPTKGQEQLFQLFDEFITEKGKRGHTFLLQGYAGTGKTSVISSLVKILKNYNYKALLLAPTGRAAKVMSFYSQRKAFTIHKIIFKQVEDPNTGQLKFVRQINKQRNTIYIVDEASMIDDTAGIGGNGLLTELLSYIFENPLSGNKLILVGDTAQLPPVKQVISPALDESVLRGDFFLETSSFLLNEVIRQEQESGILENATKIRNKIAEEAFEIQIHTKSYPDIYRMNSDRLEDGLRYAYDKYGIENTSIVCRTNRSATMYNKFIRQQIQFAEEELIAGDYLMIVRNNYNWLPLDSPAGFLANGEFVEIMRVNDIEEKYDLRFADLTLRLVDYPDHPFFDAKIHLELLHSYTPNLSWEKNNELYEKVRLEYMDVENKMEQMMMLKNDEHLNALQVKYAYALTCHKSQGGQWDAVFVDMGYLNQNMRDVELLRWLYTAMTRASKELFLVNFASDFFC